MDTISTHAHSFPFLSKSIWRVCVPIPSALDLWKFRQPFWSNFHPQCHNLAPGYRPVNPSQWQSLPSDYPHPFVPDKSPYSRTTGAFQWLYNFAEARFEMNRFWHPVLTSKDLPSSLQHATEHISLLLDPVLLWDCRSFDNTLLLGHSDTVVVFLSSMYVP